MLAFGDTRRIFPISAAHVVALHPTTLEQKHCACKTSRSAVSHMLIRQGCTKRRFAPHACRVAGIELCTLFRTIPAHHGALALFSYFTPEGGGPARAPYACLSLFGSHGVLQPGCYSSLSSVAPVPAKRTRQVEPQTSSTMYHAQKSPLAQRASPCVQSGISPQHCWAGFQKTV